MPQDRKAEDQNNEYKAKEIMQDNPQNLRVTCN